MGPDGVLVLDDPAFQGKGAKRQSGKVRELSNNRLLAAAPEIPDFETFVISGPDMFLASECPSSTN
jgi:hypothetical protein